MQLIFDVKKMTQAVVEMKYDVKKMPLGKLRPEQIKAGYESLKAIEELIKKIRLGWRDASFKLVPHGQSINAIGVLSGLVPTMTYIALAPRRTVLPALPLSVLLGAALLAAERLAVRPLADALAEAWVVT